MKLYRELAHWWQLFSPVEEYADEAASFVQLLRENCAAAQAVQSKMKQDL